MVGGSFGDTGAFGNVINSRGVHALFHKQGASRFDERATPDLGPPRRTGRTGRAKAPLEDAAAGTMSFFRHVSILTRLRSEEHTSELQSLMRISYAVFCLKKKQKYKHIQYTSHHKITVSRQV